MTPTRLLRDIEPAANPLEISGRDEAVLLVHGMTGTPAELRPLGEELARTFGWEVRAPLLPGHGTTIEDLSGKTLEDWLGSVNGAVTILSERFDRIHLLGLSMGAALCLEVFRQNPERVASLVLLAPALWLHSRRETFWAHLLPRLPVPARFQIQRKRRPRTPGYVGYDSYSLPAVRQFFRLGKRVRAMPRIDDVPALLIFSEGDRTVHPKSARFVAERLVHPGSKVVRLEKAEHVLTLSSEKERVTSEIVSFYRGITSPS